MRYLNPSDIRQALSYEEMMAAVEEAFLLFAQGRCAMADRSALTQGSTTLATMPCFAGGYAATKLLASCPDNPRRGLPSLYGTVLLSQGDTGQPVALLEGNTLTALRTGSPCLQYRVAYAVCRIAADGVTVKVNADNRLVQRFQFF